MGLRSYLYVELLLAVGELSNSFSIEIPDVFVRNYSK